MALTFIVFLPLIGCSSETAASSSDSSSVIKTIRIKSIALGREMEADLYLPPGYSSKKKYPVLYIFYGYGGNTESWFSTLNMKETADQLIAERKLKEIIIVSPDYANSFGVNTTPGEAEKPFGVDEGKYEDYLMQEIIPYVDDNFSTIADREGRNIGGASMGGYTALYLGFTYPDRFSKIGAHSAAIWNYTSTDEFTDQRDWLYANEALRNKRDPFKLAEHNKLDQVDVYLDAGDQDFLAEKDQSLYETLRARNIHSEWHKNEGVHNMSYWSSQMKNYLLFYAGI